MIFSVSFRVVFGWTVMSGRFIIPLVGMVRGLAFSPDMSPVVCLLPGCRMFTMMSCVLIIPTGLPSSRTGRWLMPYSLNWVSAAPTVRSAFIVCGALFMMVSILLLPHSCMTAL
jgi:hypothetical protein